MLAVGHSSECFSFIKDWVDKNVRRHLAHAQKRKGFGWPPTFGILYLDVARNTHITLI